MACPRVASVVDFPVGARSLLYECWIQLLHEHLPDPQVVDLLIDWQQMVHRSIYFCTHECCDGEEDQVGEPHNPIYLDSLSAHEVDGFCKSLEAVRLDFAEEARDVDGSRVRGDLGSESDREHAAPMPRSPAGIWVDEEFDRLSRWIWLLQVVDSKHREKHWPPPHIKTRNELIDFSRGAPTVGCLYPEADLAELRRIALAALAAHFFSALCNKTDEHSIKARSSEFLETWSDVFERGTFRLSVTHGSPIGMSNGIGCRIMVYDFDTSSNRFHCFPAVSSPAVRESFLEGQLDL